MMPSITRVSGTLVPITRFNRGEAGRIFDEVNEQGVKIAVRNNEPACVLVKPEVYDQMIEALGDMALLLEAEKRDRSGSPTRSIEDVMKRFSISPDDLNDVEAEIE